MDRDQRYMLSDSCHVTQSASGLCSKPVITPCAQEVQAKVNLRSLYCT